MVVIKITDEMQEITVTGNIQEPDLMEKTEGRLEPGHPKRQTFPEDSIKEIQRTVRAMDEYERAIVLLELVKIYREQKK